jgi:hypothetical protein
MFKTPKLNHQWRLKRFLALLITFLERISFFSSGELIIKDAPLLSNQIFENVEKTVQPGVVRYLILSKETLSLIVQSFQTDEFLALFNRMGVTKPKISYVTYYQTGHLEDPTKSVYANHWHTDDTLRPNAVKFFQLPEELDESVGPMETLEREDTISNWKQGFIRGHIQPTKNAKSLKFMSAKHGLLLNTNKCMHRAGIPANGKARRMLMVQINDGAGGCSIDKLYERQFTSEPTLLKNLFSSK